MIRDYRGCQMNIKKYSDMTSGELRMERAVLLSRRGSAQNAMQYADSFQAMAWDRKTIQWCNECLAEIDKCLEAL